jgi:hypothetical protein
MPSGWDASVTNREWELRMFPDYQPHPQERV